MNVIRKFYATGFGNLHTSQKNEPQGSPGPPFLPTSADNGLSVDPITGRIVLGNDTGGTSATLLSSREIPANGFAIQLTDLANGFQNDLSAAQISMYTTPGNDLISTLNPGVLSLLDDIGAGARVSFDDGSGNQVNLRQDNLGANRLNFEDGSGILYGIIDWTAENIVWGDDGGATSGAELVIVIPSSRMFFGDTLGRYLDIDKSADKYQMGDLSGANNHTELIIDDNLQIVNVATNNTTDNMLFLRAGVNGLYQIGDIDQMGNGAFYSIDDFTISYQMQSGTLGNDNIFKAFGPPNWLVSIGDNNSQNNGTILRIDDVLQLFEVVTGGVNGLIRMDVPNATYEFGDIDGLLNGSHLQIDDTTGALQYEAKAGNLALDLDPTLATYKIGATAFGNNSQVSIDDTARNITLNALNGIITTDPVALHRTNVALGNNAGAGAGTILNAPTAGNPTKWIRIVDNGVNRFIPTWT